MVLVLLLFPISAQAQARNGGVEKTILSNGLTLLVKREPEARTAAIEVFIRVGAKQETDSTAGIGHLLAGTLLTGTEGRSPRRLAELVSQVGGNFRCVWQSDYIEINAVTLPLMCDEAIGLLSESVRRPSFDPEAIERARKAILRQTRLLEDSQYGTGYDSLVAQVHRGGPYGRPYLGDPDAVSAITRPQLEAFYRKYVVPNNIVIAVVGNVDPMRISRKVESSFGGMEYAPLSRTGPPASTPNDAPPEETPDEPEQTAASYVMIGYPAPSAVEKDYPAACIANVLLGGNKSSLMFTRLREEQGIGYQVGSIYPLLRESGHVAAFVGMDSSRGGPEVTQQVKDAVLGLASSLADGKFSDEDVERAKKYLIGSHALKHERTKDRAYYLGLYEAVGLSYRYDIEYPDVVRSVTRADVERVCREIFSRTPAVVTVGR
jgi:predicted Zn-dependent peptidase